jgi:hypothetical protein
MTVVVEYGAGNPGSIVNIFKKVGAKAVISSDLSPIQDRGRKKVCILVFSGIVGEMRCTSEL